MITNNEFYIEKLKYIFLLGYNKNFEQLININKSFKLNTSTITHNNKLKKKTYFIILNKQLEKILIKLQKIIVIQETRYS